jgi:hypothetical protein
LENKIFDSKDHERVLYQKALSRDNPFANTILKEKLNTFNYTPTRVITVDHSVTIEKGDSFKPGNLTL